MCVPELFETTEARAAKGIDDTLADLDDLINRCFFNNIQKIAMIITQKLKITFALC